MRLLDPLVAVGVEVVREVAAVHLDAHCRRVLAHSCFITPTRRKEKADGVERTGRGGGGEEKGEEERRRQRESEDGEDRQRDVRMSWLLR